MKLDVFHEQNLMTSLITAITVRALGSYSSSTGTYKLSF